VPTRLSVAQSLHAESSAEPLSSTFHRRLLWLLSGRATIDSVKLFAIIATACLALLAAACGGSAGSHVAQLGSTTTRTQNSSSSSSSATSAYDDAAIAFSRCMRSHGVPNFPDPDPQGNFPSFQTGVSKQTSVAANEGCKHLLPRGGGSIGTPQQRQEKLVFGLKVARCVRRHGFPTFPDPSGSSQGNPPGIDLSSPQFQTAETSCEQQVRKALGLP
jgi:hypothetical protein